MKTKRTEFLEAKFSSRANAVDYARNKSKRIAERRQRPPKA